MRCIRLLPHQLQCSSVVTFALLALCTPNFAFAHPHPGATPAPHDVWNHWGGTPLEIALILGPAVWYALGVRAVWASAGAGHGVTRLQAAAFAAGTLSLCIALLSPLDAAAEALFSFHMMQHLLLIVVAAPLWVLGAPLLPSLWALPVKARRRLATWWNARRALRITVAALVAPAPVFIAHSAALWFWHFPGPYQAALRDPAIHALEHAAFFGTALLFWWEVIQPAGRRRVSYTTALILLGGVMVQGSALGAVLMFARHPWYPAHGPGARAWGVTLMADQQAAGLIMWVPAGLVYVVAAAILFVALMRADERRETIAAGALTANVAP